MALRTDLDHRVLVAVLILSVLQGASQAHAQSLDWEGQTGGFLAPSAYTALSPRRGLGRPTVAFHVLDGGDVLGTHLQMSLTLGFLSRVEAGVTRSAVSSVGSEPVASLFDRGFTTLHAKLNLLREGGGGSATPAISAGGLFRWQSEHIGADIVPSDATRNADAYLVVTKTLVPSDRVSFVLNGGIRATKASFFGIAGNTPSWEARAFAAGVITLIRSVSIGGEFLQQPAHIDGFPDAEIPSTIAGFIRVSPPGARRLSVDAAFVRAAGTIQSGVDLKAENRIAAGLSFRF